MNARRNTRQAWRDVCHDLREDDGINPKELKKECDTAAYARLGPLCKQVGRCVQLALSGCADATMRDLMVVHVEPAPDATRLRVEVCTSGHTRFDELLVKERLERLKGFLRAQIAEAVIRKRAPDLVFAIVPTPGGGA